MAWWRDQGRGLTAAAMLLAALVAAPAPVLAADSALDLAQKAIKSGKPDLALRALNAALTGGTLKGGDVAKAYFLRGMANAKSGNQAATIADLNNALYLKGLSEAERKEATAAKIAAYRAAGVPVTAGATPATATADAPETKLAAAAGKVHSKKSQTAAVGSPASAEPAANAEPLPWQNKPMLAALPAPAPTAPAPTPAAAPAPDASASGDNPFNSLLGGLFGLGKPAPAMAAPAPAAAASATASTTEPSPAWKTASATAKLPVAQAVAKAGGIYLQVASLRTTGEADALAAKLASDHAATLAGIQPSVAPTVLGNMGTFYAVRLGPVASKGAGQNLCAKLRKEGVDCFLATP